MSVLSDEYLSLIRNFAVTIHCAPIVYRIIIKWGWDKDPLENIKSYIIRKKLLDNIFKKENARATWLSRYDSKLSKTDVEDFDVTFLHELLPVVCNDQISKPGTTAYDKQVRNPDSIESLLKSMKDKRNYISHDETESTNANIYSEFQELMERCIEEAGTLYKKSESEIVKNKKIISAKLDEVIHDTSSVHENRIELLKELIIANSVVELEETATEFLSIQPLQGSVTSEIDLKKNFYCLNLARLRLVDDFKENKQTFSFSELFEVASESFIIISGGPGSGKTTLLKNLFLNTLQEYKLHISENGTLRLPIYLECRTDHFSNLEELIETIAPMNLGQFKKNELSLAIQLLDHVIFFVDGYDEINDNSAKLVNSIINFCKKKKTRMCIISGRLKSAYDIERELEKRCVKNNHFSIEPLRELKEKIEFLKTYSDELAPDKTDDLIRSFCEMKKHAQNVFSSPILLSLYYFMFSEGTFGKVSIKNDADVNEVILIYFKDKISQKINPSNDRSAAEIINVMSEYCLELFKKNKYFLLEADFARLAMKCEEKVPDMVNVEAVLDCLLTPQFSIKLKRKTRQFLHSIIQEYFAAKGLVLRLQLQERLSIEIFLQALGFKETDQNLEDKLRRYHNIMHFVILDFYRSNCIAKFSNTFVEFMKKFMEIDARFSFDLISATDLDPEVLNLAVNIVRDEGWEIRDEDMQGAAVLLQHLQPRGIDIKMSKTMSDYCSFIYLMDIIKKHFNEKLYLLFHYSRENYEPLDDLLSEVFKRLEGTKVRIAAVAACITRAETVSLLKSVLAPGFTQLNISFSSPSDAFIFKPLENCDAKFMKFTVKYSAALPDEVDLFLPTPANKKPTRLILTNVPAEGAKNSYNIIRALAPLDKTFARIVLQLCDLPVSELRQLSAQLYESGYRSTFGEGTGVVKNTYDPPDYFLLSGEESAGNGSKYLGSLDEPRDE